MIPNPLTFVKACFIMILSSGRKDILPTKTVRNVGRRDRHSKRNRIFRDEAPECVACAFSKIAGLDREGLDASFKI